MVAHLLTEDHANGQRVPQDALDELGNDADRSPIVEVVFSKDRTCKAEVRRRRDGLLLVSVFREISGDGEYEPEAYWSPQGRDVVLADSVVSRCRL
jgi:hypothetical protein